MDSSPTLQDFVLNLIYDPIARSAFELDPQGALQDAGLDDVTAADVQEVIPLVVDYAPLGGAAGLSGLAGTDDLTTGVANLDVAGAVAHLQAITSQVTGTVAYATGDLNIAAASAVTVTADNLVSGQFLGGVGLSDGSLLGGGALDLGGLTSDHDPAAHLDAGVSAPLDHVAGVVPGADSLAPQILPDSDGLLPHVSLGTVGALDGVVNTVPGLPDITGGNGPLDLDVAGVHEATSSIVGGVVGPDAGIGTLPDTGHLGDTLGHASHTVSGVTDGLTGDLVPEAGHDAVGGLTDLHF